MATKDSQPNKSTTISASDTEKLVMALRQSEERVSELTDLVSRLNRGLRGLEEQNQMLAARLQAAQPGSDSKTKS